MQTEFHMQMINKGDISGKQAHAWACIDRKVRKKWSAGTFVDLFSAGCGRFGQGETLKKRCILVSCKVCTTLKYTDVKIKQATVQWEFTASGCSVSCHLHDLFRLPVLKTNQVFPAVRKKWPHAILHTRERLLQAVFDGRVLLTFWGVHVWRQL